MTVSVGKLTYDLIARHSWELWAAYHENASIDEMMERFDCSSHVLGKAFRLWGLDTKKFVATSSGTALIRGATNERDKRIIAARQVGRSYENIGAEYGVSRERIRQILKRVAPELARNGLVNRKGTDKWLGRTRSRGRDIRVSRILAMRRQKMGWHTIAKIVYPNRKVGWGVWRVREEVKLCCKRHNLDPSPAFYDLHDLKRKKNDA